jgi:hypothetical protein
MNFIAVQDDDDFRVGGISRVTSDIEKYYAEFGGLIRLPGIFALRNCTILGYHA